jgi:hypothetical protein
VASAAPPCCFQLEEEEAVGDGLGPVGLCQREGMGVGLPAQNKEELLFFCVKPFSYFVCKLLFAVLEII